MYVCTYVKCTLQILLINSTPLNSIPQCGTISEYKICSKSMDSYVRTVPPKDNIALIHLSQIIICMLDTLCSMHFSCAFSFIIHRTLDQTLM